MNEILQKLKQGINLSFKESKLLFGELMNGKYTENETIEILESFIKKGETKDEIAGGVFILRDKASKVKTSFFKIYLLISWLQIKKNQRRLKNH